MKPENTIPLSSDTASFLESLLWANSGPDQNTHWGNWTIHQFHPEFTDAVTAFLDGFREYLSARIESHDGEGDSLTADQLEEMESMLDPDQCERSFGSNVYFSLSGHGAGFRDERDMERGEALHAALLAYSGNPYRFENIDLMKDHGRIHLAYRTAAFRREYLVKLLGNTATVATA